MNRHIIKVLALFFMQQAFAQRELPTPANYQRNPQITTGVPYLLISADARSAGMGDMGVATSVDAYSQQYNAAKYAFATKSQGVGISYTPYLSKISNDISLSALNYFNKINERNAVAASLRYFSLGEIKFTGLDGSPLGTYSPNEFAVDLSYSIKLAESFSGAVTARYINSNLRIGDENQGAASSLAVDLSGFYESPLFSNGNYDGRLRAGFSIQNIGPKITYSDEPGSENFLPTNLRLGAGYDFILDQYNKISVVGELTKLMVPTPQEPKWIDLDGDGTLSPSEQNHAISQNLQDYRSKGWLAGAFGSFADAPGGFSEEMKEFTWALGAEYWYQDSFAFRGGYFHESEEKGGRQYATLGTGFRYNTVNVDVSYVFSMGQVQSPLDSTLRFSLTFNFGKDYRNY